MTTKDLSKKQIIIPMNDVNRNNFIRNSNVYVTNMNRTLKNIKTDIIVNFVHLDWNSIIVMTNKIMSNSELQMVENYIKNTNYIINEGIKTPRLLQFKSYPKIIGILFLQENTNTPINLSIIENIIKKNHIFNNIMLVSKPCIIKISPKSDMAIIWINIWNVQSSSKVKRLINRCFNIENFITTIRGANMNLNIPKCKNCWRWGHAIFLYRIQRAKCVKCNSPHKSEHHCQFVWCCKANKKTNPPRLETKKGKSCSHSFRCLNC